MRTWWGPPGGAAFILHREPRPDGTTGRVPILNVVGTDDFIEFVEDRAGHDQRYALDTDKIETLGWEPEYTFEEGLGRAVQYYLN